MSGIATAVVGAAVVGAGATYMAGKSAEKGAKTQAAAIEKGADVSAQSQREQLEYLKEVNRLPQQYREQALADLSARRGQAGVPLPEQVPLPSSELASQEELISQAKQSPLYSALMGSREAGEEAILRRAGATGGLRSGNVQANLYDYNVGLQNTALSQAYNQALAEDQTRYGREQARFGQEYNIGQTQYGQQVSEEQRRVQELQGLAGIDTGTSQISNVMGNIGSTQAQGIAGAGQALSQGQIAQGQIYQQGMQGITNTALTGLGLGIRAGKI